jgi:hypothetical protein
MSLFAACATVADRAIFGRWLRIVLTWNILQALISSSAGFCREILCKIWRAPRRAQRFLGNGPFLRRGSGRDADLIQIPHQRFDSRITSRTMPWLHLRAGGARDTARGKLNSSRSCLVFLC